MCIRDSRVLLGVDQLQPLLLRIVPGRAVEERPAATAPPGAAAVPVKLRAAHDAVQGLLARDAREE
eukprot:7523196-Alexandrium_andersonii.AAC.1